MVSAASPSIADPATKINGHHGTQEASSSASSAPFGIDGATLGTLAPPVEGIQPRSRAQSRRASNQSKELSEMDLPIPSRLVVRDGDAGLRPIATSGLTTNRRAPPSPGLLSANDLDASPFVKSVPGSPYMGAASSPQPGDVPRFGNTTESDDLVQQLEKLDLPEPEVLDQNSRRGERERTRAADEIRDAWSSLQMPEPEYVTRANMRASGARTPEPVPREDGEALPPAEFVRRASLKR